VRWVLLGRTLESTDAATPGASIDALWLAKPLGIDDEMVAIVDALAGPSGVRRAAGVEINGHEVSVSWSESVGGGQPRERTVVAGWACHVRHRAFFLRERLPSPDLRSAASAAAELVRRFPCDHSAR